MNNTSTDNPFGFQPVASVAATAPAGSASLPLDDPSSQAAWEARRRSRHLELLRPNFLVRWAFYASLFTIPFAQLYIPGTGERLGIKRVVQALILAAMVSRPRVCLRLIPIALFWFAAYWCLHLIAGLWLAPEYSAVWWPNTIELVQFLLPWTWMLF